MSAEHQPKATRVTFRNEPRLLEHEVNKASNEKRLALASRLESFLAGHDRFRGKEVSVTFAHTGVSSLIAIIETPSEKLALKIPLSRTHTEGEAEFLGVWEEAGVKTPHVFGEGAIDEHAFILMEYIDAPILTSAYSSQELVEKGIYREMGQTLRRMHEPHAEGYGRMVGGKAEFSAFSDWLHSPDMEKRVTYVREHGLLGEEHGSLQKAFDVLEAYILENPISSYCHDDFGASNIFATTPITVFDPNPRFHNGYFDLGRTVLKQIAEGIAPAELLDGYFEGASYNKEVLQAAVLLNAYMKFPYWHKVEKDKQIRRVQEYFARG
jgi:fructosamine-3-kinase